MLHVAGLYMALNLIKVKLQQLAEYMSLRPFKDALIGQAPN